MIEIRLIGTNIEIEKALDCLRNDYQIGSVKLFPERYEKYRCYIRAAHKSSASSAASLTLMKKSAYVRLVLQHWKMIDISLYGKMR